MKVSTKVPKKFEPITITIESPDDLKALLDVMYFATEPLIAKLYDDLKPLSRRGHTRPRDTVFTKIG